MNCDEPVRGDMLKITEYTLVNPLPDPFQGNDGRRIEDPAQWIGRRRELEEATCALYGQRPPQPEFLDVEALCDYRYSNSFVYRVHTGLRRRPLCFRLQVILPRDIQGKCPVIVDGDQCFIRQEGYLEAALSRGIGWALFDRTEIAHDVQAEARGHGALYETYPGLNSGAISCWAWGYSRCVDALEKLDLPIDLSWIAFTGHSRGGKTALLAGALDTRARVVNSNESGAGGSGCYRLRARGVYEGEAEGREERLRDSLEQFPYWYGPDLEAYVDNEAALPLDLHFVKALVAPRTLFISEAAGDLWANPVGSWQTTMAAGEVYRFLGAENRLFWYYRPGSHDHTALDARMLANVILHEKKGEAVDERMFRLPFARPALAFDWRCPVSRHAE